MHNINCPYCKEEVNPKAIICKHCHQRINLRFQDKVVAAILNQNTHLVDPSIPSVNISDGAIMCYLTTEPGNKEELKKCIDEQKAISIILKTVDEMRKELERTFVDIIWSGGDIDPLPDDFEKLVRKRFSNHK